MEHAEGGSLRDAPRQGALRPAHARELFDDILAGLAVAHARDIVHGDLKPENILLTADGRAKLADFGSAYSTAPAGTMASLPSRAGPGTLLYMAPEQVEGSPPSKASDLFAVAAMAYEMLTGQHHVEVRGKSDLQVRQAIVRAPLRTPRELPAELRRWLEKGLAKTPGQRWGAAEEMRAALARAMPVPSPRPPALR